MHTKKSGIFSPRLERLKAGAPGFAVRAVFMLCMIPGAFAQTETAKTCQFDINTLQFPGTARQQAACLLRRVAKWGKVDPAPAQLPPALAEIVGEPVEALKDELSAYLAIKHIKDSDIGGPLAGKLSRAHDGADSAPAARYFVIHDTSSPQLGYAKRFPSNNAAQINNMTHFGGQEAVAHMFVSRKGETLLGHDFNVPWRATKLENDALGLPAKGLFLHVELLQPRRHEPSRKPKNDAIAPIPGFTAMQYEKLALLYAAASARGGAWLIPAFHATVDEGIHDAHDDPQNFELNRFAAAIAALRKALRR